MALSSAQIGTLDKAFIYDSFNTLNYGSPPLPGNENTLSDRYPDLYYRDPNFYAENTTYDPRMIYYPAILGRIIDGNLLNPSLDTLTYVLGGDSGFGANYIQVNESQMAELSPNGGNIIWQLTDKTIDMGQPNDMQLLQRSRDSIYSDNPIVSLLASAGMSIPEIRDYLEVNGIPFTLQGALFNIFCYQNVESSGLNISNPILYESLRDTFGSLPQHVVFAAISRTSRNSEESAVRYGGIYKVAGFESSTFTNFRIESSTFKSSGVTYDFKIDGLPPGFRKLAVSVSPAEVPEGAIIDNTDMQITSSRLYAKDLSQVIWYDGPVGIPVGNNSEVLLHEVGVGLGSNAGYGSMMSGWKVGSI